MGKNRFTVNNSGYLVYNFGEHGRSNFTQIDKGKSYYYNSLIDKSLRNVDRMISDISNKLKAA